MDGNNVTLGIVLGIMLGESLIRDGLDEIDGIREGAVDGIGVGATSRKSDPPHKQHASDTSLPLYRYLLSEENKSQKAVLSFISAHVIPVKGSPLIPSPPVFQFTSSTQIVGTLLGKALG
jgi:hypothetical protein